MKNCIVTGGANGIGRCITQRLIEKGYFVCVIDIDGESGKRLSEEYSESQLFFFQGDIADKATLEIFAKECLSRVDKIDIVVNNACIGLGGLMDASYEDFCRVFKIGTAAPFYLTKLFMEHFSSCASVINISSTRAFMSQYNTECYTAAKGGISALTRAMSITLAGKARVNSISPGWIDTGAYQKDDSYQPQYEKEDITQHPSRRIGNPDDIANAVLFLCDERNSFINGEDITVDGGMTKQMIYHNDFGWKLN